jgi:hypothetical protein
MKKLVGLMAVAMLFTLTITAQEKKEFSKKRTPFTSEQTATLQSKKMALHLDLDEKQQNAVYELMKKNADERKKKMTALKEKKEQGLALSAEERFQHENDRLDNQREQKAAIKNILTKEQYEKWEKANIAKKKNSNRKMGKLKNMRHERNERDMKPHWEQEKER